MNSSNKDTIQPFKECAVRGCSRQGIHYLNVLFINKYGWFCDSCKTSLIDDNLVMNGVSNLASEPDNNS